MVLYTYMCVCVYAFSLHRESTNMILGDKPLIFEVVLSHRSTLSSRHCPFTPSCHPRHSSGCCHPHYCVVLLGCRRGVPPPPLSPHCRHCLEGQRGDRRPHCLVVHQGSRNLHLYIHYSIWIVDCGGVHLA
jgi:hypothetical protein